MDVDQVELLFLDLADVTRNLKGSLLATMKNHGSGRLSFSAGGVTAEVSWPYPYGDRKLDLRLEIRAEIPREEES